MQGKRPLTERSETVGLILLILAIAIVLAVIGFWAAIKILWIIALVLLALWLIGFLARGAGGAGWSRR
jgi:multisubunit Na+/H+ antiporter MnhG subunit